MTVLLFLLLGTFIGWLIAAYLEVDEGIFACMFAGALGGLIGGRLLPRLFGSSSSELYKILLAIGGAVLCALISRAIVASKRTTV